MRHSRAEVFLIAFAYNPIIFLLDTNTSFPFPFPLCPRSILFICGGAFIGLDKMIQDRSSQASLGFTNAVRSRDPSLAEHALKKVDHADVVRYGLIPEFAGNCTRGRERDGFGMGSLTYTVD